MTMHPVEEDGAVGVLILNQRGAIVFANYLAQRLCYELTQVSHRAAPPAPTGSDQPPPSLIPHPIWRSCQAVMESRELFPNHPIVIEDEIKVDERLAVQLQARWLDLDGKECSYLLVMLEEQAPSPTPVETLHDLTPPETEVWLLRQAGYSDAAIAVQLNLSIDVVQRHLDRIHTQQCIAELLNESLDA